MNPVAGVLIIFFFFCVLIVLVVVRPQRAVSNWPEGWECASLARGDVCFKVKP